MYTHIYTCIYMYVYTYIYIYIFPDHAEWAKPCARQTLYHVEKTYHFPAKGPQQRVNLLREAKPRLRK